MGYHIALVREDYLGDMLLSDQWVQEQHIMWVADLLQAYLLLLNKKVDFIAADLFHMQLIADYHNQTTSKLVIEYPLADYQTQLHLVANPRVPSAMVKKIRRSLLFRQQQIRSGDQPNLRLSCEG